VCLLVIIKLLLCHEKEISTDFIIALSSAAFLAATAAAAAAAAAGTAAVGTSTATIA